MLSPIRIRLYTILNRSHPDSYLANRNFSNIRTLAAIAEGATVEEAAELVGTMFAEAEEELDKSGECFLSMKRIRANRARVAGEFVIATKFDLYSDEVEKMTMLYY